MYSKKFRKKYRIPSTRLPNHDYGGNGYYFITICTINREQYFGKIFRGVVQYTDIGLMANVCWRQIPKHFPFVILDEWVIMPDHVHGIIVIDKKNMDLQQYVGTHHVETRHGASLHSQFGKLQHNSLQSIINHFKGAVTKHANRHNIPFAWQPRYYDHVIRNEWALNNIRRYISNNPKMWHNGYMDKKF